MGCFAASPLPQWTPTPRRRRMQQRVLVFLVCMLVASSRMRLRSHAMIRMTVSSPTYRSHCVLRAHDVTPTSRTPRTRARRCAGPVVREDLEYGCTVLRDAHGATTGEPRPAALPLPRRVPIHNNALVACATLRSFLHTGPGPGLVCA